MKDRDGEHYYSAHTLVSQYLASLIPFGNLLLIDLKILLKLPHDLCRSHFLIVT